MTQEKVITQFENFSDSNIRQGDFIENVDYIESVSLDNGIIEVSKILFPLVVVITQDCDVLQHIENEKKIRSEESHDKTHQLLLSMIVVPVYPLEHIREGLHLDKIKYVYNEEEPEKGIPYKYDRLNSSKMGSIKANNDPRYHFLKFVIGNKEVDYVIDFKHYFTVNTNYIKKVRKEKYLFTLEPLFKSDVNQRFSNYLSRIGLPTTSESIK